MQRGMPTYIKRVSAVVRSEMRLSQFDRVCPVAACDHLDIPLLQATTVSRQLAATDPLFGSCPDQWSAATGFIGTRRFIVVNDTHHPNRQVSSIAHELGHALLLHPPAPVLRGDGFRNWDGEIEEEAAFFAGVFLVPDEACRWILKRGVSVEAAANEYAVSESMLDYRLNLSGARKIQQRKNRRTTSR